MGGDKQRETNDSTGKMTAVEVSLCCVVAVHPDTALQKVAGRWMAATSDDHLHTFEAAGAVSEVGERIVELVDGVRTVEQIIELIVNEFEVSRASAEQDTRCFIGLLISKHVLRVV